jgi:hypothetical protein
MPDGSDLGASSARQGVANAAMITAASKRERTKRNKDTGDVNKGGENDNNDRLSPRLSIRFFMGLLLFLYGRRFSPNTAVSGRTA